MHFSVHDSDSKVLADIRELLYILASTWYGEGHTYAREAMLAKFEKASMEPDT